jgi:hypothetical protein
VASTFYGVSAADASLSTHYLANSGRGVAGRGRPEAARWPALKFVEKLLTTNLTSTDTTERNAEHASRPARRISRAGYRSELRDALVVVAVPLGKPATHPHLR